MIINDHTFKIFNSNNKPNYSTQTKVLWNQTNDVNWMLKIDHTYLQTFFDAKINQSNVQLILPKTL
jgi:hypothetical protein